MGLATQIHWSRGNSFSLAVSSVCEHFNTFTGVFFWQWTVHTETKNHLQNFHMRTSKSCLEHLWIHRHMLLNTFNACTNTTKIDFFSSVQSKSLWSLQKFKRAREHGTKPFYELEIQPCANAVGPDSCPVIACCPLFVVPFYCLELEWAIDERWDACSTVIFGHGHAYFLAVYKLQCCWQPAVLQLFRGRDLHYLSFNFLFTKTKSSQSCHLLVTYLLHRMHNLSCGVFICVHF